MNEKIPIPFITKVKPGAGVFVFFPLLVFGASIYFIKQIISTSQFKSILKLAPVTNNKLNTLPLTLYNERENPIHSKDKTWRWSICTLQDIYKDLLYRIIMNIIQFLNKKSLLG